MDLPESTAPTIPRQGKTAADPAPPVRGKSSLQARCADAK